MSTDTERVAIIDAARDLTASDLPPVDGDAAQTRMAAARHSSNSVWSIGGPLILFFAVCGGVYIAFH